MPIFKKKTEDKKEDKQDKKQEPVKMKDLYADQVAAPAAMPEAKLAASANAHKVLVKPLITEKAAEMGALNKYLFAVSTDANKIEIARAIASVYGIKPLSVNIVNVSGKKIRHGRTTGQRKNWKKAVITLPAGQSINIYEGV